MAASHLYKVLVVGDSRMRHLETYLNATALNLDFTVKTLPGARLSNIALSAMAALSYSDVYHLVIIAGINDMSKLVHLPSKHALPRYASKTELIDRTLDVCKASMEKICAITDVPVVLATIAGMDLASYSPDYADLLSSLQRNFNRAVVQLILG